MKGRIGALLRSGPGIQGKPGQLNPKQFDMALRFFRPAGGEIAALAEINDQVYDRAGFVALLEQPLAAPFDHAFETRGSAGKQSGRRGAKEHAVVGHESRECPGGPGP